MTGPGGKAPPLTVFALVGNQKKKSKYHACFAPRPCHPPYVGFHVSSLILHTPPHLLLLLLLDRRDRPRAKRNALFVYVDPLPSLPPTLVFHLFAPCDQGEAKRKKIVEHYNGILVHDYNDFPPPKIPLPRWHQNRRVKSGGILCCYGPNARALDRQAIVLRRAQHASHLLAGKPSRPPLLGPRDSLDRAGFLHERGIKLGRHAGDDTPVVAGELGRRHRYRRRPPEVVRRVAQVRGNLSRPRRGSEAGRRAVRHPDGGEPREPGGESRASAGLLGEDDLVKQADRRVAWQLSLAIVDEFVKG